MKIKTAGLVVAFTLSLSLAYALGYYRGFQIEALNSTVFELATHTTVAHEIHDNKTDFAKKNLKMFIEAESKALRKLDSSPFKFFCEEYSNPTAKDHAHLLELADKAMSESN